MDALYQDYSGCLTDVIFTYKPSKIFLDINALLISLFRNSLLVNSKASECPNGKHPRVNVVVLSNAVKGLSQLQNKTNKFNLIVDQTSQVQVAASYTYDCVLTITLTIHYN